MERHRDKLFLSNTSYFAEGALPNVNGVVLRVPFLRVREYHWAVVRELRVIQVVRTATSLILVLRLSLSVGSVESSVRCRDHVDRVEDGAFLILELPRVRVTAVHLLL